RHSGMTRIDYFYDAVKLCAVVAEFAANHVDEWCNRTVLGGMEGIRSAMEPDEASAIANPGEQLVDAVGLHGGVPVRSFGREIAGRVEDNDLVIRQVVCGDQARVFCAQDVEAEAVA